MGILFKDGFESGPGKWITKGECTVSREISHGGTASLCLNGSGSAYRKLAATEVNSPNRLLTFHCYLPTGAADDDAAMMSLGEGVWDSTDKTVEMFLCGNHIYFNLYRYRDKHRVSTTRSDAVPFVNDRWFTLEIASDTRGTIIKLDGQTIGFEGKAKSSTLTNVYNLVRSHQPASSGVRHDHHRS